MTFSIVTDSATNLEDDFVKKHKIIVVPTYVIIDNVEYLDHEITNGKLIEEFKLGKFSTTSQPSSNAFLQKYSEAKKKGKPILGIHISSKLSGTFNGARLVASQLDNADVKLIDTLNLSFGAGYFIQLAVQLREIGCNRDQVIMILEDLKKRVHIEVLIDDIAYLRRGGRVNIGQFWFLKLFSLKPIITNRNGKLVKVALSRGREHGLRKLAQRIQNYQNVGKKPVLAYGHSNTKEDLSKLKQITSHIEVVQQVNVKISATLMSHTGPNVVGMMIAPGLDFYLNEFDLNSS